MSSDGYLMDIHNKYLQRWNANYKQFLFFIRSFKYLHFDFLFLTTLHFYSFTLYFYSLDLLATFGWLVSGSLLCLRVFKRCKFCS